ncbi:MAG: putative ABC transporter ATP-binding protein [Tenericutes bacterium ADurb.Bin024]|nr:MAG: putative ABC transporter ATP-binding protein [Tenericutes bacterium ADurb.Bin024]
MITKDDVTLILQYPYFFGDLRIIDNLKIGSLFSGAKNHKLLRNGAKRLQIGHILKRKANVCSGGEKARANILRGIIENRNIILVDEPTAHLDLNNSKIVATLLSDLSSTKIVIVTTHQPALFKFANTIFLNIEKGSFIENVHLT